jgi:hypothetical protein
MRALFLIVAAAVLCGCAARQAFHGPDDKLIFSRPLPETEAFRVGDERWYYIGSVGGVHYFALVRKLADGRSEIASQVSSSRMNVAEPFPLTYTMNHWKQADPPQ